MFTDIVFVCCDAHTGATLKDWIPFLPLKTKHSSAVYV